MLDPYRMIVINGIASIVLACGLFVYRFIYPKKKINLLFFLILTSLLPLISLLRKGAYESGGFSDYVKFAMSFYDTLMEGNIIPQWDSLRCAGFGCPQFIFMYTFPYYFMSFFHILGFSFINGAKLLLSFSFIASGIAMYVFIKETFGEKAGFIAGFFYLFAPYHLVDLHFRTDLGEAPSFAFIPFLFMATSKIIKQNSIKWAIIQAIVLILLLLSHQAIFFMTTPFLLCYGIYIWKNMPKKTITSIKLFLFSFTLFLLLSAFYWIPIVLEAKDIYWGVYGHVLFIEPISLFFLSPWQFGFLFQGPKGELSFVIGYIHLFIIIAAILFMIRKTKYDNNKKHIAFFLMSFLIAFFMMLPLSQELWNAIPFLSKSQFSYRLLLPISFFTSVIAAVILRRLPNKWIIVICAITMFSTILNWGHRRTIPTIDDAYLKNELTKDSPVFEVTIPKWVDLEHIEQYKRLAPIEITSGNADIVTLQRKTEKHEYVIHAKTSVTLRENTFYYPGWKVFANNNPVEIAYTTLQLPGTINFTLPKGLYKVELSFTPTPMRIVAQYISLISFFSLITFLLFKPKLRR